MSGQTPETRVDEARREFLRNAATASVLTLAPGVTLMTAGVSEAQAKVDPGKRWGMLIDTTKCASGCDKCVTACKAENGWRAEEGSPTDPQWTHEEVPENEKVPWAPRGQGCVESCTMCVHRVDAGGIPACAEACDKGAILFGDLNDSASEISKRLAQFPSYQIRADLGCDPGVRYARLP